MNRLLHQHAHKIAGVTIVILFSISIWQLASAGWIQGKAIIAQQLLYYSWQKTLEDIDINRTNITSPHKPWPWADTWPVARLVVPRLDINQIILAGDSGNSLAFAPGYSLASASPNTAGTTMISAHRDTHFNFLKNLMINDILYLQTAKQTVAYQVFATEIVDSKQAGLELDNNRQTLVLVTCYPFDALVSGGSLRYLIFASATELTSSI